MIEVRHPRMTVVDRPGVAATTYETGKNAKRTCVRCGRRNTVRNERFVGPYICRDCKWADPEYVEGTVMAPRQPYAMTTLLEQVAAVRPEAPTELGSLDGLEVYRTVTFDAETSAWLWPLISDPLDQRLASGEMRDGVLTLTFQGRSPLADDPAPFIGIPAAGFTQAPDEDEDADKNPPEDDSEANKNPPAKKAPARKRGAGKASPAVG